MPEPPVSKILMLLAASKTTCSPTVSACQAGNVRTSGQMSMACGRRLAHNPAANQAHEAKARAYFDGQQLSMPRNHMLAACKARCSDSLSIYLEAKSPSR